MITDLNEAIDAGAATTARTFRYTEAEEAGKILTDAEVTVVALMRHEEQRLDDDNGREDMM